jgi:serine/threonine-protein phosphatase 5
VTADGELEPEVDEDKIITDEDRKEAAEVKAKANKAFAGELNLPLTSLLHLVMLIKLIAKDFKQSIELYTQAISLDPKDSTLWNNRAMSKGRLEEHGGAIADTSEFTSACEVFGPMPDGVLS